MGKRVFIIHGWDGYPEEGWFPWLRKELEDRGVEVFVPKMPDAAEPRINKWIPTIAKAIGQADENTYFIGHSMGVQAIVRYLSGLPEETRTGGAVFVAGFFKRLTNMGNDPTDLDVVKEWLKTPINLNVVKDKMLKSAAVFSESDLYVPLDNQDDFKDKLKSEIIILPGPGHFSGPDDKCTELPEVLTALEKMF